VKKNNQNSIEKLRAALEELKKLRLVLSDIGEVNGEEVEASEIHFEYAPSCFELEIVGVESNKLFLRSVNDRNIMFSVTCKDSSMFTTGEQIRLDSLSLGSFDGCSNVYKYTKEVSV
jgi:hypothetical protein